MKFFPFECKFFKIIVTFIIHFRAFPVNRGPFKSKTPHPKWGAEKKLPICFFAGSFYYFYD